MGVVIIPFAIDVEKVKSVFGSKNEMLHEQIINSSVFKKYDEFYSFKRELKDVIFNYIPKKERVVKAPKLFGLIKGNDGSGLNGEWNDYGHALLCICTQTGHSLIENEGKLKYNSAFVKLNEELIKNGSSYDFERVTRYKRIFDTPFEEDDICTNYFDKNEVIYMYGQIKALKEKNTWTDIEFTRLIDRMERGFSYCMRHNLDWVSFSYET